MCHPEWKRNTSPSRHYECYFNFLWNNRIRCDKFVLSHVYMERMIMYIHMLVGFGYEVAGLSLKTKTTLKAAHHEILSS